MTKVKDINYVAFLAVEKGINFDNIEKHPLNNGKTQTFFIYDDLEKDEYFKCIADYNKSNISSYISKLRDLKTVVHSG